MQPGGVVTQRNLRNRAMALFCACALGLGLPAHAQEEPMKLSMQSALLFALKESPRLAQMQERRTQAKFASDEADSVYMPQISARAEVGAEYNDPGIYDRGRLLTTSDGNTTAAVLVNLSLRQMIYDAVNAAESEKRTQLMTSAERSLRVEERDVLSRTIRSYLEVYRLERDVENNHVFLDSMTHLVERLRKAYEAGAESKAKMKYADARLTLAQSRYTMSQSTLNDARNKLQQYTGVLPAFTTALPSELDLTRNELDYYQKLSLERNQELKLNHSNILAGKHEVEKARGAYMPKVNFVLEGEHDNNINQLRQRNARAMFQVQYDVFNGNATDASVNRANSKLREMEFERKEILDQIRTEVAQVYNEILSARQTIELKKKEAQAYRATREVNMQALGKGDLDTFEVIENEERLQTANQDINRLESQLYASSYDLLRQIGTLEKARFCESC